MFSKSSALVASERSIAESMSVWRVGMGQKNEMLLCRDINGLLKYKLTAISILDNYSVPSKVIHYQFGRRGGGDSMYVHMYHT